MVDVMTMTFSRSLKIEVGLNEDESPQTQTPKGFWKGEREKSDPTYDAWGRQSKSTTIGSLDADFGYTKFYMNRSSGLDLTLYRAYDPEKGRWLSRDPLGEYKRLNLKYPTGPNLYAYVKNDPMESIDPLGLEDWHAPMWPPPDPTPTPPAPAPSPTSCPVPSCDAKCVIKAGKVFKKCMDDHKGMPTIPLQETCREDAENFLGLCLDACQGGIDNYGE